MSKHPLMAALAEFERDLLRERVRSGISAARKRGVVFGRCQLQLTGALPPINHFTASINRCISRRCSLVLLTIATSANVSWPDIGIRLVKRLTGETMSSVPDVNYIGRAATTMMAA
jgi:DNA invertase Pin-like site-specific DNA recombinase